MSAVSMRWVMPGLRGKLLQAAGLCWLLPACDGGYPLAPTACDEWCRTSQRKRCPDDAPVSCVSECERQRQNNAGCDQLLLDRVACYDRIPDDAFACDPYTTYLRGEYCDRETFAFQTCAQPNASACLAFCDGFVPRCEGHSVASCAMGCYVDELCEESFQAFYSCIHREDLACDQSNIELMCEQEIAKLNACRSRLGE